jgi:glycosyltransferase involved in cell wall biosynthesis
MSGFEWISTLPVGPARQGEGGLRTRGVFKAGTVDFPLITVITVVFNGQDHLAETIQSIVEQTYPNLEFIVIDGGSKDHSVEILRKFENQIDYWVSEKDKGISDAFNKGITLAAGDYINFQGDGDGFTHRDSIKELFSKVDFGKDLLVAGRVYRVDLEGKTIYTSAYSRFKKTSLLFRMSLPHQGLFTHRTLFERYGLFDVTNKFCMDYEVLLRAYHDFPRVHASPVVVAKWRADGVGNGKTRQILKEYDQIKRKNRVAPAWVLSLLNSWSILKFKIKQTLGAE